MSQSLDVEDVRKIVRLLSEVSDSRETLLERKAQLLGGLSRIIDADVWIWSASSGDPSDAASIVPVGLLDRGWENERERTLAFRSMGHSDFQRSISVHFNPLAGTRATRTRRDAIPDAEWYGTSFHEEYYRPLRFTDFILSLHPVTPRMTSAIGFHRREGKPFFGERERCIVHVVTCEVDWLHRTADVPGADGVHGLSPRLREVLLHLLSGDSRKQIAHKLDLSEHTINSYLKTLHKHFNVNSRGELMTLFMAGGPTPPPNGGLAR